MLEPIASYRPCPVRVLYAGCGPYALLAVPIMAALPRESVMFTLLDIHPECLESPRALIGSLGLADYLNDCICADATRYRIPADQVPYVIVSETMAVTLHNEPQVAIARHLLSQASAALMVPQSVSVEVPAQPLPRTCLHARRFRRRISRTRAGPDSSREDN